MVLDADEHTGSVRSSPGGGGGELEGQRKSFRKTVSRDIGKPTCASCRRASEACRSKMEGKVRPFVRPQPTT